MVFLDLLFRFTSCNLSRITYGHCINCAPQEKQPSQETRTQSPAQRFSQRGAPKLYVMTRKRQEKSAIFLETAQASAKSQL